MSPLSFVPSRTTARRLLLLSLLAGGTACSSGGGIHAPGTGGASPTLSDAGADHAAGVGGAASGTGGATPTGAGGAGGVPGSGGAPVMLGWQVLDPPARRKVDILFMVDNSPSMLPLQNKMSTAFPAFTNALKALPMGLPDLHLAVVSSDTGPGGFDLPQYHCSFRGDGGKFQTLPRGICAAAPLATGGPAFLQASNNQQQKNYTGDIADAFNCIAQLGDQGCGFEGQLKSVRWALDPLNVPDGNAGFLRTDAYLVVVLITNEDDCSVPDDSQLADPTQTLPTDPLGALWSYRCNQFGHLCNINGTLQPPPSNAAASNLQGCVSNEGPTGLLLPLSHEVAFLKGLKSNPNQILVSVFAGPPTPYSVEMIQQGTDVAPHPNIVHSCIQSTGEYADPSVRLAQWASTFGANGSFQSICADSFAAQMQALGGRVASLYGPACVSGPFPAVDGGAHPACRVVDRTGGADGGPLIETLLPHCADNGNVAPCWTLEDDSTGCLDGKRLAINRGTAALPADLKTAFTCAPCAAGSTEIGCQP